MRFCIYLGGILGINLYIRLLVTVLCEGFLANSCLTSSEFMHMYKVFIHCILTVEFVVLQALDEDKTKIAGAAPDSNRSKCDSTDKSNDTKPRE